MARGPFVTNEEITKWTQQFANGVSISQMAKESGRTYNTVKRTIDKASKEIVDRTQDQAAQA